MTCAMKILSSVLRIVFWLLLLLPFWISFSWRSDILKDPIIQVLPYTELEVTNNILLSICPVEVQGIWTVVENALDSICFPISFSSQIPVLPAQTKCAQNSTWSLVDLERVQSCANSHEPVPWTIESLVASLILGSLDLTSCPKSTVSKFAFPVITEKHSSQ